MRFVASSVLLAACAHLALASPIKTQDGLSAGVDNSVKGSGNVIDGSGNIIDRSIKGSGNVIDGSGNIIDRSVKGSGNVIDGSGNIIDRSIKDIEHAPNQLEARGSIFDIIFCYGGGQPWIQDATVNMDGYWNLAVAGRGGVAPWVTAPLNDDDLRYRAYTNRQGGVAFANFEFEVHPLAHFPPGGSVGWAITSNRSGTITCVARGAITDTARRAVINFVLDATASYTLTIQDSYE